MRIKLDEGAIAPVRAHDTDAGLDLFARDKQIVPAHGCAVFNTGVHVELPKGTCGMLKSKSGLYVKYGIMSNGLVDEGYTGEIVVKLVNTTDRPYLVSTGEKITQLVVVPCLYVDVEIVDEINGGARGENGFGSTGR